MRLKGVKINLSQQGDSIEFLSTLIELIDKEITGNTKNKSWKNTPQLGKIMLNELYELNRCTRCGRETIIDLSQTILNLTNPNNTIAKTTISKAISETFMNREQSIPCTSCRNNKVISTYTHNNGKYTWLKINRIKFNQINKSLERINHQIKPEKRLTINQGTSNCFKSYTLLGGIAHYGSANSGHYIYITKKDFQWYSINDDKVSMIGEDEAIHQLEHFATLIGYEEEAPQNPCPKDNIHSYQTDKRDMHSNNYQNLDQKLTNNFVKNITKNPLAESFYSKKQANKSPKHLRNENLLLNHGSLDNDKQISQNNWKTITMKTSKTKSLIPNDEINHAEFDTKNWNKASPYSGRRSRKSIRIYIEKPKNSYFDSARGCFYLPKAQ